MNSNDPVISLVLGTLRKFFSNTPELNMTLSGVLVSLAIHPDCSLAGWLTFATPENTSGPPVESSREVEDVGSDEDDRSIDYRIQEDLAAESNILPASRMDDKSRPIVHAIFQSLVSQLDRYRQIVNNFDQLLQQRRQGLLFSENLNDALSLGLNVDEAISPSSLLPTTPEKPKAKSKSAASSFVSFLTPRKKSKPTPPVESSEQAGLNKTLAASPFGSHYLETISVTVEPFIAPSPTVAWPTSSSTKWNADEEDVFSSGWSASQHPSGVGDSEVEEDTKKEMITLSQLLDNVVILEESIKELAAVIHARRSLGIDAVRYI
ncbi:hypothetical protein ONZ45_g16563 [Pleurotus djamor]|nr:hypothetical protein ONZ45_g16563 [Pleurotus djamor]